MRISFSGKLWRACAVSVGLITSSALGAPVNDQCPNAVVLGPGVINSVSTTGATLDGPGTVSCGGSAVLDVWYTFTPVRSGTATLSFGFSGGVISPIAHFAEVFNGNCGGLGSVVGCTNQTSSTTLILPLPVTANTNYLVRVGLGSFPDVPYTMNVSCSGPPVPPASTSFTYQGRLLESGTPVNGSVDMVFKLFDDPAWGLQIGTNVPLNAVPVSNGIFAVQLNFGAGTFDGSARWLEITVGGSKLLPRQEITPAPYALRSVTSGPPPAP